MQEVIGLNPNDGKICFSPFSLFIVKSKELFWKTNINKVEPNMESRISPRLFYTYYYKWYWFSAKSKSIPDIFKAPFMSNFGSVKILIYCSDFEIFETIKTLKTFIELFYSKVVKKASELTNLTHIYWKLNICKNYNLKF